MSASDPAAVAVVAHRGASQDFPEHSLEAFVRAIEVGADALECDVRLTADGHLVCVHDSTVERTSSGRGPVAGQTLAQLRSYDWRTPSGGPLTLRELFELARDCGRRVELAVETKHPSRFGGAVEAALTDLMDWFGWLPTDPVAEPSPVRVMSFSGRALARVRRRSPLVPLVYLVEKTTTAATRAPLPGHAGTVGICVDLIGAREWLSEVRARGHGLHVWTVDDLSHVEDCLRVGATAIITNRPDEIRRHLNTL